MNPDERLVTITGAPAQINIAVSMLYSVSRTTRRSTDIGSASSRRSKSSSISKLDSTNDGDELDPSVVPFLSSFRLSLRAPV